MLPLYGMDLRLLEWFVLLLFGLMVVYIGGVCLFCFGLIVTWLLVVGVLWCCCLFGFFWFLGLVLRLLFRLVRLVGVCFVCWCCGLFIVV